MFGLAEKRKKIKTVATNATNLVVFILTADFANHDVILSRPAFAFYLSERISMVIVHQRSSASWL